MSPFADDPRNFWTTQYGLTKYGDLFTARQLVALTTFSDLVQEARERVKLDASPPVCPTTMGSTRWHWRTGICGCSCRSTWHAREQVDGLLARTFASWEAERAQALGLTFWSPGYPNGLGFCRRRTRLASQPVAWELELALRGSKFMDSCQWKFLGDCEQQDDAYTDNLSNGKVISTDPPYYDNIGYADLSDFFYVWLRRSLKSVFPDLFATVAVPKAEELVATPYRHGSKEKAEAFFLAGMTQAMHRLAEQAHPAFPVTIYYAFKQSESETDEGTASTGWETFLDAVIRAGFGISGTWPMRTELRQPQIVSNALASSIVLVCRPRATERADCNAPRVSRRAQGRAARGTQAPPTWQHRAGGSGAGSYRPRHGGLYALFRGARRRGQLALSARSTGAHQSDAR